VLLTRPGDDVGPAGRMLLAWRRLAVPACRGSADEGSIAAVWMNWVLPGTTRRRAIWPTSFGSSRRDRGTVGVLIGAFAAPSARLSTPVGAWLADALLAQRLGWTHAVPLLGAEAAGAKPSPAARGDHLGDTQH
jgi:hypothetical protein